MRRRAAQYRRPRSGYAGHGWERVARGLWSTMWFLVGVLCFVAIGQLALWRVGILALN